MSVKSLALPEGKQSSQETNASIRVKDRPSSARAWARAFQQGAVFTQFTYRKTGFINRSDDTTIQRAVPQPWGIVCELLWRAMVWLLFSGLWFRTQPREKTGGSGFLPIQ